MAVLEILGTLVLAGSMGMVGQGVRVLVGLKKLNDENALKPPGEADLFIASRLVISLFVGFIAGVGAALALGIKQLMAVTADDINVLMGLAAAGYAGTDAIEALVSRVSGSVSSAANPAAATTSAPVPEPPPVISTGELEASVADVGSEVASLKSMLMEASVFTPAAEEAAVGDALDGVTAAKVKQMFVSGTPLSNIVKHLPSVIGGLRAEGLADRSMLLMALSTIRAESEGFAPISEFQSKFNTAKTPFDLYDKGTEIGKKLGNTQVGDGPKFRGRGFVQLTGRDHYTRIGKQIGLPLTESPELANDSHSAGRILARFLKNSETKIRAAIAQGNLKEARRLVNGGSHGLERFVDAYHKGENTFP